MAAPIRIAIFDDHRAVRDMLREALSRQEPPFCEVVAEGGSGQEAMDAYKMARPDLIVLDLMLPGLNGVEVLMALRRQAHGLRVVIFTGYLQELLVCQTLALGVSAFVSKASPLQVLLDAIRTVASGGKFFDPLIDHLVGRAPAAGEWQILTAREREVVALIASGKSTKEAAVSLGISTKTVDKHRSRMMKKLRMHDAVALTRYAILAGLAPLN